MTWKLSRYHAGDLVEVRSREEILATLDGRGCLDRMPFMPEMLQYCGKRLRVAAVAHKSCDMIGQPGTGRRVDAAVHLAGVRCDGSAHGGCEAECNVYWKDAWLKPVADARTLEAGHGAIAAEARVNESGLYSNTVAVSDAGENGVRYSCQATQMYEATAPLPWWDARQYLFDVTTRNHSVGRVATVLFLAGLRWLLLRIPFGYRAFRRFHDRMHEHLIGRPAPSLRPGVAQGGQTPTGTLGLQAGEYVRIKDQSEIEPTLDQKGNNRGLSFDSEEMAPYCGQVVQVRKRVSRIVDERTGRMLRMKQPCVMLEGVVCKSTYVSNRLNCPRAIPSFWREIWLERARDEDRTP
ncbi:MAG: hypothetical protein ACREU6_09345 [Steroidobacteraceae bacterium]